MGNPPKRVVLSKLMRRYFKRQGQSAVASEEAQLLKNELIQCWEANGVDHPNCEKLIPKFDRGWALDMITRQRFEEQVRLYPGQLNKMLAPMPNKMYFKGTASTGFWRMNKTFKMPKY